MTQLIKIKPVPKDRNLIKWSTDNMPALIEQSAQFIDKPATQRMIQKNIRYLSTLSGKSWDKIWSTLEGQESISNALGEALYHAATLPEMGSIVPFGNIAEFIPSVECYEFALTTGKNAPFENVNIILVHDKDKVDIKQTEEDFKLDMQMGIPRGEVLGVVVYATIKETGKRIGQFYDVERLLSKAERHSPAYRNFLIEKEDFKRMEVEGKLKKDSMGRVYMEKKIEWTDKGQKKSWDKKIYEHDIVNPYDGPDRPEMLKKAAGKSFFRPYMKTRNAAAMADEWQGEDEQTIDQAADNVLEKAVDQFENVIDAEVVNDEEVNSL